MGEMHGFEVLRRLRENPDMKHTVVIMTSAKATSRTSTRARPRRDRPRRQAVPD
jgi:CheY-like chemotaxis protein